MRMLFLGITRHPDTSEGNYLCDHTQELERQGGINYHNRQERRMQE